MGNIHIATTRGWVGGSILARMSCSNRRTTKPTARELAAACEIVEGEGCGHNPLMANMFASA